MQRYSRPQPRLILLHDKPNGSSAWQPRIRKANTLSGKQVDGRKNSRTANQKKSASFHPAPFPFPHPNQGKKSGAAAKGCPGVWSSLSASYIYYMCRRCSGNNATPDGTAAPACFAQAGPSVPWERGNACKDCRAGRRKGYSSPKSRKRATSDGSKPRPMAKRASFCRKR